MASSDDTEASLTPVDFIQLQHYMEYSTLRVKDVIKEFQPRGRLAQHSFGECVDAAGFCVFLKTYLEVDDFPTDFCQRLFHYFQHVEQDGTTKSGVFLRDVSCYFSVLEDGQPRDKLEFTFKLYDKDGNGLLDSSEVDRIITQMMRAADYLGWDVTELRPVLKDMMTAIDADDSGTVTLEEWVKGGMNNVPLLMIDRDGQHIWRMKHFNRPTYCSVCQSMLLGLGKQGLCCTCCKYTVHSQCANKNPELCARTFVRSKSEIGIAAHDWIRADCNSTKCQVCHRKIKTLAGRRCVWCQEMRHDECLFSGLSSCDCGPLRDHILPPWAIYAVSKDYCLVVSFRFLQEEDTSLLNVTHDGHILQIVPIPGVHPLLVFVNPKSGGKQGERVLRKFQYLLNPRQVYNLSNGGPGPGYSTLPTTTARSDKADLQVHPPVAVLPLGTGNDLARCLRWGGGYEGSDLREILKEIEASELVPMDRWSIQVIPEDPREAGDPVPYEIINNYFSVGVDASIAHRFHSMREKHPQRFNIAHNALLCLHQCCGRHLDLSSMSLEAIAVLNIPSIHGGSNLWGESKKSDGVPEVENSEVITDPELLKAISQDMSDKRLEVVGLEGVIEMGQIYTGLKSAGHRLAQTSQITIRTIKALPMQIDGEPWMQPPCTIHITHKNQANMLMAAPTKASGFFHLK
uniref:Diacylglycerol kinase n=1 Tax=Anabas testudineus TaxID=64144 RepID=A0A7N6B7Q1_ANATE